LIILLLAVAPQFLSAGVVDRMTALFIYVILARCGMRLAGFGGLVSVGQQVFFGLGAISPFALPMPGSIPSSRSRVGCHRWRGVVADLAVHAASEETASSPSACG